MKRKIFKTGHSAAVTISAKLLKELGLKVGDYVAIEKNGEQLTVKIAKPNTQLSLNLSSRKTLGQVVNIKDN